MNKLIRSLCALTLSLASAASFAGQLPIFSGWNAFASEDQTGSGSYYLSPGSGGQAFDAEYLFYKQQGNLLSIGLQTGFDIISANGQLFSDGHRYYAGDLALSFDGNKSNYEYAIDFGNLTKNYADTTKISAQGNASGMDAAGLYKANSWNNDIYFYNNGGYSGVVGVNLYTAPSNGVTYMRTTFIGEALSHDTHRKLDTGIIEAVWLTYDELVARKDQLRSPMTLQIIDEYRVGRRFPLAVVG